MEKGLIRKLATKSEFLEIREIAASITGKVVAANSANLVFSKKTVVDLSAECKIFREALANAKVDVPSFSDDELYDKLIRKISIFQVRRAL